jgi:hypothetical protein
MVSIAKGSNWGSFIVTVDTHYKAIQCEREIGLIDSIL